MPSFKPIPKYLFLLMAVLCTVVAFTACTRQRDRTTITFSVGGTPSELLFWETLVGHFEQKAGVKVSLLRQPTATDQRRQGLVVALASQKDDPDVFLMDIVWIAQFAASGWLEPLARRAQEDAMDLGVFFPNVLDLADRYEGSLVALPVYVDGGLLYYREDLLRKAGGRRPPQLWSELVEQSMSIQEQVRDADPGFYAFVWQGAQYEGLVCNFLEFCASNGGGIWIDGGRVVLDTPENRAAAQFMVDLIHTFKVSPPSTYTQMREEDVRIFFQQGGAAFERNWPYAWPLHQSEGSPVRDRTGIAPLPHFPKGKTVSTLGGWHVGVSKYSDEKALGWELVKFLVSYETQKKLALELGWNPGRRDLYNDQEMLQKLPHFADLGEILENALPRPTVPYYAQLSEVIQRHVSAMLAGAATPEAALAAAEREAQRVFDRYEKR